MATIARISEVIVAITFSLQVKKREKEKEERHDSPPYIIIVAVKKDFIDLVTLILHYNTPSQLFNISFINAKSPQTSPATRYSF
jgi:hypothetical protein